MKIIPTKYPFAYYPILSNTGGHEDMWTIRRTRDFEVILFSLNASPPLSLSRVINNGLSFVGFNAATTPHKAKLYPSWAHPLRHLSCRRKGVAREKTSRETCSRNCFGVSLNQIPRFFRIGEHLRVFCSEIKPRSQ